jgi:hypothetical protein
MGFDSFALPQRKYQKHIKEIRYRDSVMAPVQRVNHDESRLNFGLPSVDRIHNFLCTANHLGMSS